MIRQFITDVCWQDVEYLIIDTPPGTSDEHIAVVESLKSYNPDGAILVTTPQVTVRHYPSQGITMVSFISKCDSITQFHPKFYVWPITT